EIDQDGMEFLRRVGKVESWRRSLAATGRLRARTVRGHELRLHIRKGRAVIRDSSRLCHCQLPAMTAFNQAGIKTAVIGCDGVVVNIFVFELDGVTGLHIELRRL